ncbi:dienelactone hydrolase family protein [Gallaecimonas kandeliae]|uniref:alpha/beta hydrolase n=1 Tax=Gallaecimonas kandeliae TaxID=3029055 RepID=UPI00264A2667|nr:dienelactone hydrolase family protein [Gallaecimonas kandeliae]WKE67406.1 dienelactone hydrolase family protein [Gallaecimonas kandeliae]
MQYLPCLELTTGDNIEASVIWLHGLGADGNDFAPVVPELGLPQGAGVRFIFPHAPVMPVTVNGGYLMPAWYDILSLDIDRKVDETQLRASAQAVKDLIARELARGIPSQRIVLAGFSQGGAVAYEAALSLDKPLAGLLALSTYFATQGSIELNDANKALPVAIHHGVQDPVVPELLGQRAAQCLKDWGYQVEYRRYPMEHSLCLPQIKDIGQWLAQVLALKAS